MPEPTAPDQFDAFGRPVPWNRKSGALVALREMVPGVSTEDATLLIDRVAEAVERDDPYRALQVATGQAWAVPAGQEVPPDHRSECPPVHLDVTGGYRLLAHLCTDPDTPTCTRPEGTT